MQATKGYFKGILDDRKVNLKRAHRAKLTVVESNDKEPLIGFFKSETEQRIYGWVGETAYDMLRELYIELNKQDVARKYAGLDFVLDFESPGKNEKDIIRFYSSVGAQIVDFPVISYDRLPKLVRWVKNFRMKMWRKNSGKAP